MKPHRNTTATANLGRLMAFSASQETFSPESPSVESFVASMPERYRDEFGPAAARQHARIAVTRGRRAIHADLFSGGNSSGLGICVVAEDASGLLALISTGLMLEGFNIIRADAYTRRLSTGDYEAIDLFWVKRLTPSRTGPLDDNDMAALRSTLLELSSRKDARSRLEFALAGVSPGASETSVRFRALRGVPRLTLELESNDRPGLLAVVTAALAAEGLHIIESRVRTHGLRVHDYFEIREADGSRPTGTRLQRIELAILRAVDGPLHST